MNLNEKTPNRQSSLQADLERDESPYPRDPLDRISEFEYEQTAKKDVEGPLEPLETL